MRVLEHSYFNTDKKISAFAITICAIAIYIYVVYESVSTIKHYNSHM